MEKEVSEGTREGMRVVVTGAAGFLGARLADELLGSSSPLAVSSLLLVDVTPPPARADPRARSLAADLCAPGVAESLARDADALFHLAAVVSGRAEEDLELGLRVNLDATRALLLAAARRVAAGAAPLVFVFASTVGVYGPPAAGELVAEHTAPAPRTSYGAAKAAAELLVADLSRRGLVDGRSLRLPTVTVRGGAANAALTSFCSSVVREPLAGREARLPVSPEREVWVTSPARAVRGLARGATLAGRALGARRVLNLPGLRVSVAEMLVGLRAAGGAAAAARVRSAPDAAVDRMVASLPVRIDDSLARSLGLEGSASFAEIVQEYIDEIKLIG